MDDERYDRQIRLFGREGHQSIQNAKVVLMGNGGNGIHVLQQLAYAGVADWAFVEFDIVTKSNLNRLVGSTADDIGNPKTDVAIRILKAIHPLAMPEIVTGKVGDPAIDDDIRNALTEATIAVGCFDKEIPRQAAIKFCSEAGVAYLDLATEIICDDGDLIYGGRVVFSHDGSGCLFCLGVIDISELAREQMTDEQREQRDRNYGLTPEEAGDSGPSVVTINGVVASLACTEALMFITGLRDPARQLAYLGHASVVRKNNSKGDPQCLYCTRWREARARRPA
jgi:hypothetical protein